MHAPRPADLRLEDVADAGRDALIEQRLADRRLGGDRGEAVEHGIDIGCVAAQIRSEAVERLGCAGRRTGAPFAAQLHNGRVEADRSGAVVDLKDDTRSVGGASPACSGAVHVPDAVQHHVRVQGRAVVEVHEQVLPARFHVGHVGARRRRPEAARVATDFDARQRVAAQRGPEPLRPPVDGVAFGHRAP